MTNGNELITPPAQQPISRVARIEERIDRDQAGKMSVSESAGGMRFQSMLEVLEFSKMMAISDVAVPKHLRGNPGACMAVVLQAVEWRMSPYAVANKSYVVNDRIAYESQLIHAVVEQRAPLAGRLRCRYSGEGQERRCTVWAFVTGETEPFEFQSAPFAQIQPKNSPLWKTKPDLQLFYNASRDWARMYFPDVILGVYSDDEFEPEKTVAVAPPRRAFGPPQAEPIIDGNGSATVREHPTDPDLVIDPATSNLPPEEQPEPDTSGAEAEPPAAIDFTTETEFKSAAEEVAKSIGVHPDIFDAAIQKLRLSDSIGDPRRKFTDRRNALYRAMKQDKFDWNTAKVIQ